MRTHEWKIAGADIAPHLIGQVIKFSLPENYREAETKTKNGESDVVAKFNDGYVIAAQNKVREMGRKKNKDTGQWVHNDVSALQKAVDEYVYTVKAEGTGVAREVKPETKVQRTQRAAGDAFLQKCHADEKFRNQMIRVGALTQEAYDEYVAGLAEVEASKQGTPTPASVGA